MYYTIIIIECGFLARPSILYVIFVFMAARRDEDYYDRRTYNYNLIICGLIQYGLEATPSIL